MLTKKQIEHYWYYFKWHFFGCLAVLIALIYTISSCMAVVEPDLLVIYVGSSPISPEDSDRFISEYSKYISDINGDGKTSLKLEKMYIASFDKESGNPQADNFYKSKLYAEMMLNKAGMYIVSEGMTGLFDDDSYFVKQGNGKDFQKVNENAISTLQLMENDYLAAVASKDENNKAVYENAVKLLNAISDVN